MAMPIQTTNEEWDAFFAEMHPRLLEWLKVNGISVDSIETYDSVVGVKTLPARYDLGGVRKTVLVPLTAIARELGNPDFATTELDFATAEDVISEWNK